jgi:hypothetical protein
MTDIAGRPAGSERETPLFSNPEIARQILLERQREIERRIRFQHYEPAPASRGFIRRRIGHAFIQIGWRIAADAPLQLAARR